MGKIRVALAGVGNCSSALVQGVCWYREASGRKPIGLARPKLGGYGPDDIDFVAAFDIDSRKVGKDLSEAIFAQPNTTPKFVDVPRLDVTVQKAEPMDGIGQYVKDHIQLSDARAVDIAKTLKDTGAEVLVNLVPTGAGDASRAYASASIAARCAFINATPTRIASAIAWQRKFEASKLPLVGDDLMDQVGATIFHKTILKMLVDRGLHVDESYQLDIGGGTESLNALDKKRYRLKREIKMASVSSVVPYKFPLVAGTSDYVDFMGNNRTSYFWVRGKCFAGAPFTVDVTLTILDGPAGAGTLIDVIRCTKLAIERGIYGPLESVSAFGFKMPPVILAPHVAQEWLEEFIAGRRRN